MRPHTLAILAAALLLRLLILWFVIARFPHNWLYSRGIELGTLAQSLVAGQGLSSPFGGSTGPTALLAPGYPGDYRPFLPHLWLVYLCRRDRRDGDATSVQFADGVLHHARCATVLRHSNGQRERNVLGGVVTAYLDADDLLGNLLVHSAAGGHDGFGAALSAKSEWTAVGADGRLFGAGRVGESVAAAGPADAHGLGGLADAKDALVFPCGAACALHGVCSVADPECARAACFHSSTQHSWLRIMGGQPRRSHRLPG